MLSILDPLLQLCFREMQRNSVSEVHETAGGVTKTCPGEIVRREPEG